MRLAESWLHTRGLQGCRDVKPKRAFRRVSAADARQAQWLSACSVWMEMWKRHGRSSSQLRTMLNDKERIPHIILVCVSCVKHVTEGESGPVCAATSRTAVAGY
eukprot:5666143-Amphidinium_carterae.2